MSSLKGLWVVLVVVTTFTRTAPHSAVDGSSNPNTNRAHHRDTRYSIAASQCYVYAAASVWWRTAGRASFPAANKILILADAGGSNGCRPRLWKVQLQEQLADQLGLEVTVCHYPAGASKWNPIEHRLFGPISVNWAGKPLRTFATLLAYVRGTMTEAGLRVEASLVDQVYEKGVKVSKEAMQSLNIQFQ